MLGMIGIIYLCASWLFYAVSPDEAGFTRFVHDVYTDDLLPFYMKE
jgi:hypothetical protein